MLYALAFIFLFGIGGLTGLFLGALATDVHLHDTYFVVAHFHYVMMGSTLFAFLGGLHYWWPKMTGACTARPGAESAAVLVTFVGFNLTFFPQFVMGAHGMPRRYYNYDADPRELRDRPEAGRGLRPLRLHEHDLRREEGPLGLGAEAGVDAGRREEGRLR
jgi:heme/copper-type cytochrome/quinol oxidase subunit 1